MNAGRQQLRVCNIVQPVLLSRLALSSQIKWLENAGLFFLANLKSFELKKFRGNKKIIMLLSYSTHFSFSSFQALFVHQVSGIYFM